MNGRTVICSLNQVSSASETRDKGHLCYTRSVGILGAWTVSLAAVANRKGEESPDDGPKRTIKSMKTEINDSSSKGADRRKSLVWPGSGDPSKQAILQN